VRVGGKFVYPPPELSFEEYQRIDRAMFVAGGVGVNPIMSMVSAMHGLGVGKVGGTVRCVRVLYSVKKTVREEEVLFYERLSEIAESYEANGDVDFRVVLFETGGGNGPAVDDGKEARTSVEHQARRIGEADLLEALGPEKERENTVVYVCGPPEMTDEFVAVFGRANGMEQRRVLCEKWW
jgi:NAD(P)H-flavin reductase